MFAGIHLKTGRNAILEKNSQAGKKLLIAGSGRCNITHIGLIKDFFEHYGAHSSFIKHALKQYSNSDLLNFFENCGLKTIVDKNGKVFPFSEDSKDVLRLLEHQCERNSTEILTKQNISVTKTSDSGFLLITSESEFTCKNLIIATGGRSYPGTGSTGDGYEMAVSLGHSVIRQKPALTPVFIKDYKFAELSGVSLSSRQVYIYRNSKKIKEHRGDFGFTHKGLSGPGILDPSRFMEQGDVLKINLAGTNITEFTSDFLSRASIQGKTTLLSFLKDYDIPKSLIKNILQEIGLSADDTLAIITRPLRIKLAELFCEYPFHIEKIGGYEMAMTTAGGVDLDEISPKTMESKICKNLYFIGEILDIDGDTGGYNLQAAFSTAYAAAMNINNSIDTSGI